MFLCKKDCSRFVSLVYCWTIISLKFITSQPIAPIEQKNASNLGLTCDSSNSQNFITAEHFPNNRSHGKTRIRVCWCQLIGDDLSFNIAGSDQSCFLSNSRLKLDPSTAIKNGDFKCLWTEELDLTRYQIDPKESLTLCPRINESIINLPVQVTFLSSVEKRYVYVASNFNIL